jgi:hypothetical protein
MMFFDQNNMEDVLEIVDWCEANQDEVLNIIEK